MQLIVDGCFVDDPWIDRSDDETLTAQGIARDAALDLIVSQVQATTLGMTVLAATRSGRLGLRIANDADLAQLEPLFAHLALVVVSFPGSADGRGFSQARRLRSRGYAGELRASGPLIADQYALACACGFNSIEIPDDVARRQPAAQWRQAQHEISVLYQPGYHAAASVFATRHTSQKAS